MTYLIVLLAAMRSAMWLSPFCNEWVASFCWQGLGPLLPPLIPPVELLPELFLSDDFGFCQLSLAAEFGKESSMFFLLLPERVEPKMLFNGLDSLDMLGIFLSLSEFRLQQALDVLGLGEAFFGNIVLGSPFLVIRGERAARFLRPYAALLVGEKCCLMTNPFGHMSRAFCCNSCLRGLLRFFSKRGETWRKAGGDICRGFGARGLYIEGETLGGTFWKGLNTGTKFLVGVFWSSCCFGHMRLAFCCKSCFRGLLRFFSKRGETWRKAGREICRGFGARGLYIEGEILETFWKGLNTGTKFLVGVFWSSCCFAKASEMKFGLLALANGLVDRIWVATVAIALMELVTTTTGLEESVKKLKL